MWQISAVLSFLVLLILFFVDEKIILSEVPICESRKEGLECFLCGSTRAFIEIKNLNLKNALALNKFSLVIFGLLVINSILFLLFLLKNIKTKL